MSTSVVQTLPKRVGGEVQHVQWLLDLDAAAAVAPWRNAKANRLAKEAAQMAQHFPRWLLTVARGQVLLACPSCEGMLVFDRGLRCSLCARELALSRMPKDARLAWFGLMPPIGIDSLPKLCGRLSKRAPPRHVVGQSASTGRYLLVPLLAVYPESFPTDYPRVGYFPELFSVPGMPARGPSHSAHMLTDFVMCLFASGQWHPDMTCREVLQQRAYAHVVKLLNYADGNTASFAKVTR